MENQPASLQNQLKKRSKKKKRRHLQRSLVDNNSKMPAQFTEQLITEGRPAAGNGSMDLGNHYNGSQQGDSVAITGFSGRLPESSNIEEFKKNLFEGVDMVNDDPRRWPKGNILNL